MGLRSRIKGRLKKAIGGSEAPTPAPVPQAPARMKAEPTRPPASDPAPAAEPAPKPAAKKVSVAQASPQKDAGDGRKPISEEKVQKHLAKTRKGVLKMVLEKGGSATLAEMHDFSERRYFIAHKKFSDLMEAMIEDAHIDYNSAESVATLTDKGKAYVEG